MNTAVSRCKSSGCKISFYCEAQYSGAQRCDIPAIVQEYSSLVNSYGAELFLPILEIDAIREIDGGHRAALAQALQYHGWSLALKNMGDVAGMSRLVPVARVVYEDLVHNQQYAQEFKQLATAYPTLLLSGIVHQGGYDGDAGASESQAMQRFQEYSSFKNVELFYGMPTSYLKVKSFDGSLGAITSGIGTLSPTSPIGSGIIPTAALATQLANLFSTPQALPPIPVMQHNSASMGTVGSSLYDALSQQNTSNGGTGTAPVPSTPSTAIQAVGFSPGASASSHEESIIIAPVSTKTLDVIPTSKTSKVDAHNQNIAITTFTSRDLKENPPNEDSILTSIISVFHEVIRVVSSVIAFLKGSR